MVPLNKDKYYYWQVKVQDIIFQGDSIFSDTYSVAILDSGTSFTLIPLKEMISIANSMEKKFGN